MISVPIIAQCFQMWLPCPHRLQRDLPILVMFWERQPVATFGTQVHRFQCEISFLQKSSHHISPVTSISNEQMLSHAIPTPFGKCQMGTGLACWRKNLWEPLLFVNDIGPSGHTLGLAGYLGLIGSLGLVVKCIDVPRFRMLEGLNKIWPKVGKTNGTVQNGQVGLCTACLYCSCSF